MARPPLKGVSENLFRKQLDAALDYIEGLIAAVLPDGDKGDITVTGGTWNIDANAVGTTEIADGAVTFAKLADGAGGPRQQTAQTASSNTSFDFTGIPSWVNRINVTGFSLSTNGTSNYVLRVGDGAVVATGYLGAVTTTAGATPTTGNAATGATLINAPTAASVFRFSATIERVTGNTWVIHGSGSLSNTATTALFSSEIALTNALDRVRITTVGGVDTFDAGTVNISWE